MLFAATVSEVTPVITGSSGLARPQASGGNI